MAALYVIAISTKGLKLRDDANVTELVAILWGREGMWFTIYYKFWLVRRS